MFGGAVGTDLCGHRPQLCRLRAIWAFIDRGYRVFRQRRDELTHTARRIGWRFWHL